MKKINKKQVKQVKKTPKSKSKKQTIASKEPVTFGVFCAVGEGVNWNIKKPKQTKPTKPTIQTVADICSDCAKANGGYMLDGEVNTMHHGKCELCGKETILTTKHDYHWPDGMKIDYIWD